MHAKRSVYIVTAVLFCSVSKATLNAAPPELAWMRSWNDGVLGYDQLKYIAADENGAYVVGMSSSAQPALDDVSIIRYDTAGEIAWERKYSGGDTRFDEPFDIALLSGGDLVVAVLSAGLSDTKIVLLRYDPKGNRIWENPWPVTGFLAHSMPLSMDVDAAGNVAVAGHYEDSYLLLVYGAGGSLLFDRTFGEKEQFFMAQDVAFTSADHIVVTGAGPGGFHSAAWNLNGDFQWSHIQPGDHGGVTGPCRIAADSSGNVIINGQPETFCGTHQNRTWKIDSNGTMLWERIHPEGKCASQTPRALAVGPNGDIIVGADAAATQSNEFGIDTIRFAGTGAFQWQRRFVEPSPTSSQPNRIVTDQFGNIFVAGVSTTIETRGWNNNLALLKYAPDGRLIWSVLYDSEMNDFAYDLSLGRDREIYVVGEGGLNNQFGTIIAKYDQIITPGDLDEDGRVDVVDLFQLLSRWGGCGQPCPPSCAADLNGDCDVNVSDLFILLANWG